MSGNWELWKLGIVEKIVICKEALARIAEVQTSHEPTTSTSKLSAKSIHNELLVVMGDFIPPPYECKLGIVETGYCRKNRHLQRSVSKNCICTD